MARPESHTVPYFPFFIKDGKTLHVLEDKYKCKGTGFFTNVLRFLSDRTDHHFQIKDPGDRLWFFSKTLCDEESGLDMINIMVQTGKLDRELWEKEMVLASKDFLDSLKKAYDKRSNKCITIDQIKSIYLVSGTGNSCVAGFPVPETPDSGFSSTDNPQSKVKKSKVKNPLTPLNKSEQKLFEKFWNEYPKKKSKGQAEKTWAKINPDEQLVETMISTIRRAKKSEDWKKEKGKFIPHPSTWLNAKGWEDDFSDNEQDQQGKSMEDQVKCTKCKIRAPIPGDELCLECFNIEFPDRRKQVSDLIKKSIGNM